MRFSISFSAVSIERSFFLKRSIFRTFYGLELGRGMRFLVGLAMAGQSLQRPLLILKIRMAVLSTHFQYSFQVIMN